MQLITSISDAQSGTFYDMGDLRVSISSTTHKREKCRVFFLLDALKTHPLLNLL